MSTHNICFRGEIRKMFVWILVLSGALCRPCHSSKKKGVLKYSRTSMVRTSLGPWKFVRDMGSSSH